jgi:hypothetical protein
MKYLLLSFLFISSAFAVDAEVSGNVEVQGRHSWNSPAAQDLPFPLTQDWDQANSYQGFGNINPKLKFEKSRLEANWFFRHSVSPLYRDSFVAPRVYTFPNRLVARDIFKLQYRHDGPDYQTDSVINKLYYEWNMDQHRITLGRMFINYGTGEIFNPINPFNQPTGLTSINNVAQGNDGGQFKFFINDKHTLDILLLGDKAINGYNGNIAPTFWLHGEVLPTDEIQIDYVIGQDQKRNKVGGQFSYKFSEAMVFTQVLYQTRYIDPDFADSDPLLDVMFGYDEQLTAKWHLRMESGYQKPNRSLVFNPQNFGDRFLPVEYFIAVANQYEIHPLVKLSLTIINEPTTGFTYGIGRTTVSLGSNIEGELFVFSPVSKGRNKELKLSEINTLAQRFVTQDVGLALRAFF